MKKFYLKAKNGRFELKRDTLKRVKSSNEEYFPEDFSSIEDDGKTVYDVFNHFNYRQGPLKTFTTREEAEEFASEDEDLEIQERKINVTWSEPNSPTIFQLTPDMRVINVEEERGDDDKIKHLYIEIDTVDNEDKGSDADGVFVVIANCYYDDGSITFDKWFKSETSQKLVSFVKDYIAKHEKRDIENSKTDNSLEDQIDVLQKMLEDIKTNGFKENTRAEFEKALAKAFSEMDKKTSNKRQKLGLKTVKSKNLKETVKEVTPEMKKKFLDYLTKENTLISEIDVDTTPAPVVDLLNSIKAYNMELISDIMSISPAGANAVYEKTQSIIDDGVNEAGKNINVELSAKSNDSKSNNENDVVDVIEVIVPDYIAYYLQYGAEDGEITPEEKAKADRYADLGEIEYLYDELYDEMTDDFGFADKATTIRILPREDGTTEFNF